MSLPQQVWDADIEIGTEKAARLIATQFPALVPVRLQLLGVGWDNIACLVNEVWVFRFPRRTVALRLLETESRLLPRLAPQLPLPIPLPTFVGVPSPEYPHPFVGYRLLTGTPASDVEWTNAARTACAIPLARFLAALHALPVESEIPGDELVRADLHGRLPPLLERLQKITPLLPTVETARIAQQAAVLAEATPVWNPNDACMVHGDLYPRHFLVDENRLPCGVIDWGDLHAGDPALDLSIAFTFLPPESDARALFHAAYEAAFRPIDDAVWNRARFRALHYGAILTLYGADVGDTAIRRTGEYALHAAARD